MHESRGRRALVRALDGGVTQTQIGEAAGVSQATVSGWRNGTTTPTAFQRAALERLLGIAPGAWLTAAEREKLRRLRRLHIARMRRGSAVAKTARPSRSHGSGRQRRGIAKASGHDGDISRPDTGRA